MNTRHDKLTIFACVICLFRFFYVLKFFFPSLSFSSLHLVTYVFCFESLNLSRQTNGKHVRAHAIQINSNRSSGDSVATEIIHNSIPHKCHQALFSRERHIVNIDKIYIYGYLSFPYPERKERVLKRALKITTNMDNGDEHFFISLLDQEKRPPCIHPNEEVV